MIIAHPPCTYLTVTGARWMYADKTKTKPHPRHLDRKQKQKEAIEFFMEFANAKCKNSDRKPRWNYINCISKTNADNKTLLVWRRR